MGHHTAPSWDQSGPAGARALSSLGSHSPLLRVRAGPPGRALGPAASPALAGRALGSLPGEPLPLPSPAPQAALLGRISSGRRDGPCGVNARKCAPSRPTLPGRQPRQLPPLTHRLGGAGWPATGHCTGASGGPQGRLVWCPFGKAAASPGGSGLLGQGEGSGVNTPEGHQTASPLLPRPPRSHLARSLRWNAQQVIVRRGCCGLEARKAATGQVQRPATKVLVIPLDAAPVARRAGRGRWDPQPRPLGCHGLWDAMASGTVPQPPWPRSRCFPGRLQAQSQVLRRGLCAPRPLSPRRRHGHMAAPAQPAPERGPCPPAAGRASREQLPRRWSPVREPASPCSALWPRRWGEPGAS